MATENDPEELTKRILDKWVRSDLDKISLSDLQKFTADLKALKDRAASLRLHDTWALLELSSTTLENEIARMKRTGKTK